MRRKILLVQEAKVQRDIYLLAENSAVLKGVTENSPVFHKRPFVSQLQARRINMDLIIRTAQCPASVILFQAAIIRILQNI